MAEDLVQVAVPAERLMEVYRLLGTPPAVAGATPMPKDPSSKGWTDELIARAYRESADRMRTVFDYLMDHPDREHSAPALAKVLKVTQPQVRGVLGGFGHRLKSRYHQHGWPVETRWDDADATSYFRMTPAQAAAFKVARAKA